MAKRILSEEELQQRREAGRRSAERRRRSPMTAAEREARHRERQDTDPRYRAETTDTIINQKLPLQLATAGAVLGGAGGLALGYAAAPPSGQMWPFLAHKNNSFLTTTVRGAMGGMGAAAGWTAGNLANEALGAVSGAAKKWRQMRGKPGPPRFNWDRSARRTQMSNAGSYVGRGVARLGYNVYATGKSALTNALHAATGRRAWATGAILGAPLALTGGAAMYRAGHWAGTSFAPYFPQEVRKSMNATRLRKSLGFAIQFRKDQPEQFARGPGRPRGRALSQEEIEQRREAARASARARRERAAAELGLSPDEVTSTGLPRVRTYTPRVRVEGQGTFRSYDTEEEDFIRRARIEDRLERRRQADGEAYMDDEGKLRTGAGTFRQSRRSRNERTFDRFLGETFAPGYGRHAARIIGSVKEASDVKDPASKYGIIGGGVGLAAGGLLGSAAGRRFVANRSWRGFGAVAGPIAGLIVRGATALGAKRGKPIIPGSVLSRQALESIRSVRQGLSYPGSGFLNSFGSSAFMAPAIGYLGYNLGRRFGTALRDDDMQQARLNLRDRDVERRVMLGGR